MKPRAKTLPGLLLVCVFALAALLGCGAAQENAAGETGSPASPSPQEASTPQGPARAGAIDEGAVREHLAHLTGVSPVIVEGREVRISERGSEGGRRAAAGYMENSFQEIGVPARTLPFEADGLRGYDVEATLRGTEGDRHLWVTAHLDSVRNPGANDDASGLTALLLIAEELKQMGPEHTVRFVAYDLEEVGLLGSSHYVDNTGSELRDREGEEAIVGNLQLDMIAYEEDGFDAALGTCGRAGPVDDAILRAAREIGSPIEVDEVCLGRSDHEPFWNAGFPAAVLTDGAVYDGYPCYHEPCDTVDKLNIAYLRSMVELTTAASALLADEKPGASSGT